jgi:hypothetical protein
LIPSFNQLHGKSGVDCVIIIFCHIIIFNKWEKQTKRYDYLEAIHTKKHNTKIIKYLTNIGTKLVCLFPQLFSHWEHFIAKWFRHREIKTPRLNNYYKHALLLEEANMSLKKTLEVWLDI